MTIVVMVKQVPDTYAERSLTAGDHSVDRDATDAVLDEINERALESALQLREGDGSLAGAEVVAVTMGPGQAADAIRKALAMGADKAVHVADDALHGTDALGTARVLAEVIGSIDGVDLVLAGNEASDGRCGAVPAVVAEILGMPALTHGRDLAVEHGSVTVVRETDDGVTVLSAELPAVVTVNEKVNEPRYPSFKGIMAAKKKPVTSLTLADLEIDVATVGLSGAWSTVTEATPKPPKAAGEKVSDDGEGGARIAAYLVGQKLI